MHTHTHTHKLCKYTIPCSFTKTIREKKLRLDTHASTDMSAWMRWKNGIGCVSCPKAWNLGWLDPLAQEWKVMDIGDQSTSLAMCLYTFHGDNFNWTCEKLSVNMCELKDTQHHYFLKLSTVACVSSLSLFAKFIIAIDIYVPRLLLWAILVVNIFCHHESFDNFKSCFASRLCCKLL